MRSSNRITGHGIRNDETLRLARHLGELTPRESFNSHALDNNRSVSSLSFPFSLPPDFISSSSSDADSTPVTCFSAVRCNVVNNSRGENHSECTPGSL